MAICYVACACIVWVCGQHGICETMPKEKLLNIFLFPSLFPFFLSPLTSHILRTNALNHSETGSCLDQASLKLMILLSQPSGSLELQVYITIPGSHNFY